MPDASGPATGLVAAWAHDVGRALRRLDPTQSRVLRLVYFERRTRDQVADELKLSPAAVGAALAAGMQALALAVLAAD